MCRLSLHLQAIIHNRMLLKHWNPFKGNVVDNKKARIKTCFDPLLLHTLRSANFLGLRQLLEHCQFPFLLHWFFQDLFLKKIFFIESSSEFSCLRRHFFSFLVNNSNCLIAQTHFSIFRNFYCSTFSSLLKTEGPTRKLQLSKGQSPAGRGTKDNKDTKSDVCCKKIKLSHDELPRRRRQHSQSRLTHWRFYNMPLMALWV